MSGYTYENGKFTEGTPLPEDSTTCDFGDYLEKNGFKRNAYTCVDETLDVYESSDGNSYLVYVDVTGTSCKEIYIKDWPNLMYFLKEYSLILKNDGLDYRIENIEKAVEKAFQAWHGHSIDTICHECDPLGWEIKMERKRKLNQKQPKEST